MKTLALIISFAIGFAFDIRAAELSDGDKQFLTSYEKVRAALAANNLADAKTAAGELGEDGAALAKSESIITARKEFAVISDRALKLAKGQEGYFHVNCPMLKRDWVQTSERISNPYDPAMPNCGVIRK